MQRSALFFGIAAPLALSLAVSCGSGEDGASAPDAQPVERPPPTFSYQPPVSGHLSEANAGDFDLVDGIAYPARTPGKGTVVLVTSKPIASPVLATSSCPATQALALTLLRNASYIEVTLDGTGHSETFIYGSPYGGQSRGIDVGGGEWPGEIVGAEGRVKGSVTHRNYGSFEFDLPVARSKRGEASEEDRMAAGYASWGGDAPVPTEAEAITAYGLTYRAVMAGNLAAYLALQGFNAEGATKIRGLAGIDEDFKVHRDRFLEPGAPETPTLANGFAAVGARGVNSKAEKFANYYEFTPCGGKLILTSIGLNPQ